MSSLLCSISCHFEHKDPPTEAGVYISNLTLCVWHFTFLKRLNVLGGVSIGGQRCLRLSAASKV